MLKFIHIIFLLVTFGKVSIGLEELTWWETASFYQIYPRSFQDTDGDGVGDLKGITQRLPYLKEIGIAAAWLSPIMTSPMVDFGYDVSDFYGIDPLFGTMEDFDEMVAEANKIGVKIIMDFVPNHSSDECEWFKKSVAGDPEYKDFYIWAPGKMVNGTRQPPSNWISVFRGPMWTWNDQRQAYYLHQFHTKQPDLNYRNPKVIEQMKDVIRFWLRKGIAGFRIDAVPYLFEVEPFADGSYPDAPRNPYIDDPDNAQYLLRIYTQDQPGTIELLYEFRKTIDEFQTGLKSEEIIILAEAYSTVDNLMKYYGDDTHEGAQIPFNTQLLLYVKENSNAHDYKRWIASWFEKMPAGRKINWVIGNHDQSRVGSRFGKQRIDMWNILIAVLPGSTVTYYGEEIGMTDVFISWEDTVDPQACQSNPREFGKLSRDPVRTPFQWDDSVGVGFTSSTPWLPAAMNATLFNVKNQRRVPKSYLNIFKDLRKLRKLPTFARGDYQVEALNDNVLIIKRSMKGYPTYITILNINNKLEFVDLKAIFADIADRLTYTLVTDRSSKHIGASTSSKHIYLMPYETVILKSST